MMAGKAPLQLRLFDICDQCTALFEQECGYIGCWMGWHHDGRHPEKALCVLVNAKKKLGKEGNENR